MSTKIWIIWAGPAWLTAAYILSQSSPKLDIHVFEKDYQVWWICQSIYYNWQIVDLWPHRFFSKIPIVNSIRKDILWKDEVTVQRQTRIYYNNKFFDYPIQLTNIIKNFSIKEIFQFTIDFLLAKIRPYSDTNSFDKFIINQFGQKLYNTFFKTYTEKVRWIPCEKLGSQQAKQRIKGISLSSIISKAIFPQKSWSKIKSRINQFGYPKYWTGSFYTKMQNITQQNWATFHLHNDIQNIKIHPHTNKISINWKNFDHIISTIPIQQLLHNISNTPKPILDTVDQLQFRNTILVYATIAQKRIFPDNRIYLHSPDIKAGRLTNFNNRSPHQIKNQAQTYLCLEYRDRSDGKLRNLSDTKLHNIARKDLQIICKTSWQKVSNFKTIKIPNSYPVYNIWYEKHLHHIQKHIDSIPNLQSIWRAWAFKYNNQDHSIHMWYLAAQNILWAHHNLRKINSDENYQEEE